MKIKVVILSTLVLISTLVQASNDNLKKAWGYFKENNNKEAMAAFQEAKADATCKSEALLGIAMLHRSMGQADDAFNAFKEFYNSNDDSYAYAYALWTSGIIFSDYSKKNKDEVEFLEKIAAVPKANGTMSSMAHYMLGKHYEAANQLSKSKEEFAQLSTLDNWQVLGTFDNISGSGFNKDWGVLKKSGVDDVFKDQVNADVKWYKASSVRTDKWFDFNYNFEISNSIMYAQTWLKSESDMDALLKSGNSGSMKIWVNDKLIVNVEDERNIDMDVYTNSIKLNKGYNRILVQIGESEANAANFMMRITDVNGKVMKDLVSTNENQTYSPAGNYESKAMPFFAEAFFEDKVKQDPSLLNYLLLAETYMRNDKVYEARKALKQAKIQAPNCTYVSERQIEAFSRDRNKTDLTKEEEAIKQKDPYSHYAILLQIDEESKRENWDGEEVLVNRLDSLYGVSLSTEMFRLSLKANRKQMEELIKSTHELFARYPDNTALLDVEYAFTSESGKQLAKANGLLQTFLKNNTDEDIQNEMLDNLFQMGKKEEAFKILKKRAEDYPYAIGYKQQLSEIYYNTQDYPNALIWANKCLEMAPYHGFYWNKKGEILEEMKNTEEAKEAYRKAIYYQPTNYEARKQLRILEGKKDLFENFAVNDAYSIYKKSADADKYPEDNSAILINEYQRVIYPEGGSEEKHELLVKILNKAGIDNWKEYAIGYNSYAQVLTVDKVEVFKKDGSRNKAETNENEIVFTNLEEGDAIHILYRLQNYASGKLAMHFSDEFNFNYTKPCQLSRYSLIVPADSKFDWKLRGADIKPVITEFENYKQYVWASNDMPGIRPEPYMPPLDDVGVTLEISSIPDWNFVGNWYGDLSATKAKANYEVKEALADLFPDGGKGMNDYQKAKRIYEFIAGNIRYSNVSFLHSAKIPQKASRTLSTKLGDCKDVSTLFVAMCKEMGVKANLVLVDTRDNGDYDFTIPTIGFNHCIARLRAEGKDYYVELTDQKLSFTTIPSALLGSLSLNIPAGTDTTSTSLKALQSKNRVPNNIFRETNIHFDNNDMIFTRKYVRTGEYAANIRNSYGDIGKEKQEKNITQMVSEDFSNPVKISSLDFKDLKSLSDTLFYSFNATVSNELSEVVGIKIVKLPWSAGVHSLNFVSLESRKFPFIYWDFNGMETNRETITMDLPAGKVLAESPQDVSLTCPVATYSLTFKSLPGKLVAARELKQTADIVNVNDYAAFKTFYQKIAEADSKQIGFKTGTAPATPIKTNSSGTSAKPATSNTATKPAVTTGTAVKH